ncbi:coiled-coil domain-containing protein 172 isoform X6 [Myripristis murdjan]|uniref:coiled-coil domain-containing protein 172 isoform X6 n=1 Tax=Myripristis murdjan TaxID=586833 RepID=UPI001175D772|nr:coiled-coil domain-containing protein 172 isoform X6 [Myripristis murdjan]
MSLESLYQQVLLTERQMSEQTKKFQEVKVNIIRCSEKIKASTDKYEKAIEELHGKAQQLSEMTMQRDLMKKNEDQLLKQIQELLGVQSHLKERLYIIKRDSKEEEEKFLQEIQRFNSDFSLVGSRETVIESQTHSEILELEKKVQQLNREMELMRHRNSHMNSMQEERGVLQLELQGLDHLNKDLDCQLSEAEAVTEYLRAESLIVSQKPLTDSTCLREACFKRVQVCSWAVVHQMGTESKCLTGLEAVEKTMLSSVYNSNAVVMVFCMTAYHSEDCPTKDQLNKWCG